LNPPARAFVLGLAEENLGLPRGSIGPEDLPADLVDLVVSAFEGKSSPCMERPYVDERLNGFLGELKRYSVEKHGFFAWKARWPGAAPFGVCLTHDVDNISHPRRHILQTRGRFRSRDLILALTGLRSLYRNLEVVANEERKRGFRSSLFLLTSNYSLRDLFPSVSSLKEEGWDIGLHGDFGTHDSFERMREAVARFQAAMGFAPQGVREHYLRFDREKTWKIMESVGFLYDTSVGSRESLGFPMGISTPFHPPNSDWSSMKIVEIPLVLMDTTLWGHMKLREEDGFADLQMMLERVKDVGGLFTLLWHQEAIRMKGGRLYSKILERLAKTHGFVSTAAGVASWWNSRSVPLVRDEHEYVFKGVPPVGLRLHLECSDGVVPKVVGGTLEVAEGSTLVRVNSPEFRLRIE